MLFLCVLSWRVLQITVPINLVYLEYNYIETAITAYMLVCNYVPKYYSSCYCCDR